MSKSCIYCKSELAESSVMDVCMRCGVGVWGEKMFKAILSNMENAKESGNLFQGSVTDTTEEIKQQAQQDVQSPTVNQNSSNISNSIPDEVKGSPLAGLTASAIQTQNSMDSQETNKQENQNHSQIQQENNFQNQSSEQVSGSNEDVEIISLD